jgi:hypothetical protein
MRYDSSPSHLFERAGEVEGSQEMRGGAGMYKPKNLE